MGCAATQQTEACSLQRDSKPSSHPTPKQQQHPETLKLGQNYGTKSMGKPTSCPRIQLTINSMLAVRLTIKNTSNFVRSRNVATRI